MSTVTLLELEVSCALDGLAVGLVAARGCRVSDGARVDALVAKAVASPPIADDLRKDVRDMLRFGKYKPTGRGKPASEYLGQAAQEGQFPRVFPLVDLCNVVSLESGLPISLIDLTRAGTTRFAVRRGRAGESYVFNSAGQAIGLEDLLLTARMPEDVACANAVKDSMATKLVPEATDVLGVIYAPAERVAEARRARDALLALYRDVAAASAAQGEVIA